MNYVEALQKQGATAVNTKGGIYSSNTLDANLNLFASTFRQLPDDEIALLFANAYSEDKILATQNLLSIMDIRGGKGERHATKALLKKIISVDKNVAKNIIPIIGDLARYDYILEYMETSLEREVISYIATKINEDVEKIANNEQGISLIGKWLPSLRTHKKDNPVAKKLAIALFSGVEEKGSAFKQYRKTLKSLRDAIKIVETLITNKQYDKVNYETVPTKAMLKYRAAFEKNDLEKYRSFLDAVSVGEKKINTQGLFCYDIIRKILTGEYGGSWNYDGLIASDGMSDEERLLFNNMWENQLDILDGDARNILAIADTSGSMTGGEYIPMSTSVGLALYLAERNTGYFKDYFMTFDDDPQFHKVTGLDIVDKVKNIQSIVGTTDVDKAFKLLLDTAVTNKVSQEEIPSHVILISDMEFDQGTSSKGGTNFDGWKRTFEAAGYTLPIIIFWNVSSYTGGYPVTKFEKDVVMISGYSTNIFKNILNLERFTPVSAMQESLAKYLELAEELHKLK